MGYEWQFSVLYQYWPIFVRGAITTLEITLLSALLALVIGLPAGVGKEARMWPIRCVCSVYIEVIRGTPALVQIVWIYYCLPIILGVQLSGKTTMIVALGLHAGAYVAEIFRAGIASVDKGQFAAAKSIGMGYWQSLRRIILPQAVKTMIPPFINEFATLLKLTTLGSAIAVYELLHESNNLIASIYRPLEVYTFLAVVFFMITYPFIYMSLRLERRLKRGE
ncbi:amino acid ABC transporter permease [Billgrantia endophytica]|uniref:Glutamate/aspartate import permease protein GltK n=1 Tax=Billgrantia endophytica TaxID=2033802 RepID=A0A2N7U9V7_9GAMM|nr:amino acid ABC transporter permease [Halomonas endophytica]PMR77219.1 ABC transporter permease [Halomonas endophytica]